MLKFMTMITLVSAQIDTQNSILLVPSPSTTSTKNNLVSILTTSSTTTTSTVYDELAGYTTTKQERPAPITDPAPQMQPSPDFSNLIEPSPEPSPAPNNDFNEDEDEQPFLNIEEPAPETTFEPLYKCENNCRGQSCEFFLATYPDITCPILNDVYHCDCTGCSCENTYQYSCLNQCAQVFSTCSCDQDCTEKGNCCSDFSDFCSDFDFASVYEEGTDADSSIVGIVIGVGAAFLVVGGLVGFFVTRKVLINERLKRENTLLKAGNANLDTSYAAPSLRSNTKSEQFGLL